VKRRIDAPPLRQASRLRGRRDRVWRIGKFYVFIGFPRQDPLRSPPRPAGRMGSTAPAGRSAQGNAPALGSPTPF